MEKKYSPCAVCGKETFCVEHILTSEQLDSSEEERQAARDLREVLAETRAILDRSQATK